MAGSTQGATKAQVTPALFSLALGCRGQRAANGRRIANYRIMPPVLPRRATVTRHGLTASEPPWHHSSLPGYWPDEMAAINCSITCSVNVHDLADIGKAEYSTYQVYPLYKNLGTGRTSLYERTIALCNGHTIDSTRAVL